MVDQALSSLQHLFAQDLLSQIRFFSDNWHHVHFYLNFPVDSRPLARFVLLGISIQNMVVAELIDTIIHSMRQGLLIPAASHGSAVFPRTMGNCSVALWDKCISRLPRNLPSEAIPPNSSRLRKAPFENLAMSRTTSSLLVLGFVRNFLLVLSLPVTDLICTARPRSLCDVVWRTTHDNVWEKYRNHVLNNKYPTSVGGHAYTFVHIITPHEFYVAVWMCAK